MERVRATALVVKNENVLLMHRFRDGEEYYVLPGGTQEDGESIEVAVLRELKEETTLDGGGIKELFDYTDDVCRNRIFLVGDARGGDIKIEESSPENKKQNKNNQYYPEWIPINEIIFLIIWPLQTREFLFKYFKL
jgi:8-oxo-dGTP pyrophosphatase MutT (NUDIX family)